MEGTSPSRKFIASYYKIGNAFYDSTSSYVQPCFYNPNTFQIVLHETSGLIDVHIEDRICQPSLPQKGVATLGIQNWECTRAVTAPGKNCTPWTAHHESYRFIPSDSASRFLGAEILDMAGNSLAFADTATSLPGLLDLQFQNICPGPTLTKYIIKTRFLTCQAAEEFITLDTINVVRKYHLPATASVVPATCGNNSGSISIIVTDSLGVPPYQYAINGGSLQNSNTFTGLYAGSYPVLVVDSRGGDGGGRNAQSLGPLALDAQEGARCVGVQAGVDGGDVGRFAKGLGHARGQLLAAGLIRAVDLGHQGAHHGRAGRHFHHLELGAVALGDLLQLA